MQVYTIRGNRSALLCPGFHQVVVVMLAESRRKRSVLETITRGHMWLTSGKCDQLKPACSRCARLSIACVGGGEQRYKFKEAKEQSSALVLSSRSQTPQSRSTSGTPRSLSRTPSSESSKVASAFIAHLEVEDVRYEMSCYGLFLKDIPQRLGQNEALDASVLALSSTFTFLHTNHRTFETYSNYGKGLSALRKCLNDPIKAQSPETMCAAYFLQICQVSRA